MACSTTEQLTTTHASRRRHCCHATKPKTTVGSQLPLLPLLLLCICDLSTTTWAFGPLQLHSLTPRRSHLSGFVDRSPRHSHRQQQQQQQQQQPPHAKSALQLAGSSRNEAEPLSSSPFSAPTLDNKTADNDDYSYSNAIQRTLGWVTASIVFGSVLWITMGSTMGEEYFAGYLVEQSLSVDNLFVFLLLFDYFKVPLAYQDRVLNWGIYGAIVFRAIMIGLGAALLQRFHAILLVFAGILVYSSAKVLLAASDDDDGDDDNHQDDFSNNQIVKFSKSLFPSVDYYDGDRFFVMVDGMRAATPLFICMIAVEISDIVFAVDSIPAVFGVTTNPLVVFASNIFAIMGLRSLYTVLSKAATDLVYLEPAVAVVLGFIGSKMILEYFGYCIPTNIALSVVGLVLAAGVWASVREKQTIETNASTLLDGDDDGSDGQVKDNSNG